MENLTKARQIAKKNKGFVSDWLKKSEQIRQFEPYAQEALDAFSWVQESLDKLPDNAPDINAEVVTSLRLSGEVSSKHFPQITTPDDWGVSMTVASTTATSGTSGIFVHLNDIYPKISPKEQKKILPHIDAYKKLHKIQKKHEKLRTKLRELAPYLEDELEIASKEFQHYKNNTSEVLSPAAAIRNVLQHFKGELFFKAQKHDKDTIDWKIMSDRLVLETPPSSEYSLLKNEGTTHNRLYDKLSKILKGNIFATPDELGNLFIEVVDHMLMVLSLVKTK